MNDKIDGVYTGLQLARNGYTEDSYTIAQLIRKAKRLHGYYVNSCNGYESEKYDRLAEKLEREIKELAQGVHLYVYFQTDPRGGTLYVSTKPVNQTNYIAQGVYLE